MNTFIVSIDNQKRHDSLVANLETVMNDAIEKLRALRNRHLDQLEKNKSEIGSLERDSETLAHYIEGLDQAIKELVGNRPDNTLPLDGVGRYASKPLSEAIEDVVNRWGTPPGLLATELVTKLHAEGFRSTAKNFYASVYSVALRLVNTNKIAEGNKDGKRSFMRKT